MDDAERASERPVRASPINRSLGFLLRLAQLQAFERFYAAYGDRGLTPGTFSVLCLISANPGIRQGTVARQLSIKPAHMTKLVRSFEDDGILVRRVPDDDRRAVELDLTPRGQALVARALDDFDAHEDDTRQPLTREESAELVSLLAKYTGLDQGDGS